MTAELPLRSVMRNWPCATPVPPLSCESGVWEDAWPPPASRVMVPAPTGAVVVFAKPLLIVCCVVTSWATWN